MYIVIVSVNKVNALVSAQVIESLLDGKPEFPCKFYGENYGPLQFVSVAVCHTFCVYLGCVMLAKLLFFCQPNKFC